MFPYVLHTMVIPSTCGMLEYRLVTSLGTSIVFLVEFIFFVKVKKSVVSLRYDSSSEL